MQDFYNLIAEPTLIALLAWWFGTGIILLMVRLPQNKFPIARGFWTIISLAALFFIAKSMRDNSNSSTYIGFLSTIVIWGWHELAFLTGWICGSRKIKLEPNLQFWSRFKQSVEAIWHHELALFINLIVLLALQVGQPNHTAICTYTLLWLMRLSSKLNLFFGVPQVGEQYLPKHLTYMASYFRKCSGGPFFFFSMSISSIIWALIIFQAQSGQVEITLHWVLLAALLGLAIVEHILMMIPFSIESVWGWALRNKWIDVNKGKEILISEKLEDQIILPIATQSLLNRSTAEPK